MKHKHFPIYIVYGRRSSDTQRGNSSEERQLDIEHYRGRAVELGRTQPVNHAARVSANGAWRKPGRNVGSFRFCPQSGSAQRARKPVGVLCMKVRADRHLSFGLLQMPDAKSSPWAVPAVLVALLLLLTATAGALADPQAGPAGAPLGPDNWQQWWVPIMTPATGDRVFLLETVVYRP